MAWLAFCAMLFTCSDTTTPPIDAAPDAGPYCGDGVRNTGERCDCGDDPDNLPDGCTAANGEPGANCPANCDHGGSCGDGTLDPGEDCDCGYDPNSLPPGCTDVNGGQDGDCDGGCELRTTGCFEPWCECSSSNLDACDDDPWGAEMTCWLWALPEWRCTRYCDDHLDCFWNTRCDPVLNLGCVPDTCDATDIGGPCEAASGTTGHCLLIALHGYHALDATPLCIDHGPLQPGDSCPRPIHPVVDPLTFVGLDRSIPTCTAGYCHGAPGDATGVCVAFAP